MCRAHEKNKNQERPIWALLLVIRGVTKGVIEEKKPKY